MTEDYILHLNQLLQEKQYGILFKEIDKYLNQNALNQPLYVIKAKALRQTQDLQEALQACRQAIALDPNDLDARTTYAWILYDLQDYVGALNASDACVLMEPQAPDTYWIAGNVLSTFGHPEQAVYPLHQAYDFMPDNLALGSYVADLYAKTQQIQDAFNLLMQMIEKYPKNNYIHLQTASLLCYAMQNGIVPIQNIDEMTRKWARLASDFQDVVQNLESHNVSYSPLTLAHLQQAFDSVAPFYDSLYAEKIKMFIQNIGSAFRLYFQTRRNLQILDIGCKTGFTAPIITPYTTEGTLQGIDISKNLLSIAQQKNLYSSLFHGDILQFLQTKNQEYDVITAGDCLSYISHIEELFQLISSALKNNGLFFFAFSANFITQEKQMLYPPCNHLYTQEYIQNIAKKYNLALRSAELMPESAKLAQRIYFYTLQKTI